MPVSRVMTVMKTMACIAAIVLLACCAAPGDGGAPAGHMTQRSECWFRYATVGAGPQDRTEWEQSFARLVQAVRTTRFMRISVPSADPAWHAEANALVGRLRAELIARGVAPDDIALGRSLRNARPGEAPSTDILVCGLHHNQNAEGAWRTAPTEPMREIAGRSGAASFRIPLVYLGPPVWNDVPVTEREIYTMYVPLDGNVDTLIRLLDGCSRPIPHTQSRPPECSLIVQARMVAEDSQAVRALRNPDQSDVVNMPIGRNGRLLCRDSPAWFRDRPAAALLGCDGRFPTNHPDFVVIAGFGAGNIAEARRKAEVIQTFVRSLNVTRVDAP